jgi:hypothetical protein
MRYRAAGVALVALLAGCGADPAPGEDALPPVHVDSLFPMEEEIRRFRADLPEAPDRLGDGAATSIDELVARFAAALESADTAVLRMLVITRAEFAYLYYPFTRYTAKPYELSPALVWFQLQQNGEKGISRALRAFAGRPLGLGGFSCPAEPVVEEANRLRDGCVLRLRAADGSDVEKRLFGTILEREGRFKFLSYSNDL